MKTGEGDDKNVTASVGYTIGRANADAATVTANNRTYNGTENPLVTVDGSTLVGGATASVKALTTAELDKVVNSDTHTGEVEIDGSGLGKDITAARVPAETGKATVSVPYTLKERQNRIGIVVWYLAENGDKTEMPTSYDGKEVSFTTTHFSNYVIAYDAERAAACPQDDTCPISRFVDADVTAWYHDGVHWALENGVMNGISPKYYNPNGDTSRAMVATMLMRYNTAK